MHMHIAIDTLHERHCVQPIEMDSVHLEYRLQLLGYAMAIYYTVVT